jgi:uncharacterized membrane protein HdeD (DUF308 family)
VTASDPAPDRSSRFWIVPLVRAAAALAVAAIITFTANHHAQLGLLAFGGYALVSGLVTGLGAFTLSDRVSRRLFVSQGVFGVVAGVVALLASGAGLGVFLYTVSVWAALTGFCELYCGIRSRGRHAAARDWLVVGGLTVVLALVFLIIPADAVLAVGLFGAYAVVIGVYLGIGAFTVKWGTQHPVAQRAESGA